jgi:hypothetical protein
VVVLLLLGFITPLFADDALMIPQNVIRFRVIPSATFFSQEFDPDGEAQDLESPDSVNVYNLSFALEYGVLDWITAALQWTPGWQFASTLDGYEDPLAALGSDNEDLKATGLNDLFIGAKVQIIGENAPVPNESHRLAFATGVIAPLSTFDADSEAEAYLDGDPYRINRAGRDVWGAGFRAYYDFVINENFFLNLYNETILYFPRDQKSWTPAAIFPGPVAGTEVTESEIDYGYELTFELEPQYQTMLSDDLRFGAGLPVTYVRTPEIEVDGNAQDDSDSYTLSIGPSVSFFLLGAPWPIDLELSYQRNLMGKNANVSNTVVLQIKNYLRFW